MTTLPNLIRGIVTSSLILGSLRGVIGGNVTVDDADPAIYYTPGHWNANAAGTCPGCAAQPNPSLVYDATWHDSQSHPDDPTIILQYTFTGTDLYIYGILWDNPAYVSNVDLVLTLDGVNHTYQHSPIGTGDSYEYQIPVFSLHNLQNQAHTARVTLNTNSNFLFDYLVYTTTNSASSASSTNSIAPASSSATTTSPTSTTSETGLSSSPSSIPSSPTSSSSSSQYMFPIYPSTTSISQKSSSLSTGVLAGLVVGALALIALLASLIGYICYKRGMRRQHIIPDVRPASSIPPSTSEARLSPWVFPLSSYPPSTRTTGSETTDAYPVQSASPPITTPPAYWEVYNDRGTGRENAERSNSGTGLSPISPLTVTNPSTDPSIPSNNNFALWDIKH